MYYNNNIIMFIMYIDFTEDLTYIFLFIYSTILLRSMLVYHEVLPLLPRQRDIPWPMLLPNSLLVDHFQN